MSLSLPSLCQALLGDQYGPCLAPTLIQEKEWEALKAQLTSRPGDLELVAHRFQRDENAVPPTYVLQASGTRETHGPEDTTLTSALRCGAQEARRLGLISQEQWHRYHWSGEMQNSSQGPWEMPMRSEYTSHVVQMHGSRFCKFHASPAPRPHVPRKGILRMIQEYSVLSRVNLGLLGSSPFPGAPSFPLGRLLILGDMLSDDHYPCLPGPRDSQDAGLLGPNTEQSWENWTRSPC